MQSLRASALNSGPLSELDYYRKHKKQNQPDPKNQGWLGKTSPTFFPLFPWKIGTNW